MALNYYGVVVVHCYGNWQRTERLGSNPWPGQSLWRLYLPLLITSWGYPALPGWNLNIFCFVSNFVRCFHQLLVFLAPHALGGRVRDIELSQLYPRCSAESFCQILLILRANSLADFKVLTSWHTLNFIYVDFYEMIILIRIDCCAETWLQLSLNSFVHIYQKWTVVKSTLFSFTWFGVGIISSFNYLHLYWELNPLDLIPSKVLSPF